MRTHNIIEYDGLSLSSIEWSAVFAGTFFALGIGLIVGLFGRLLGAGPDPFRSFGFTGIRNFTGIWSLITAFISFYCGGWLAARLSGSPIAGDGRVHGIVTWAFGTVAIIALIVFNSQLFGFLIASVLHQSFLSGNTVASMVGASTVWAFLALICGLVGAVLGGHVGGPRMTVVEEPGEETTSRAA